MNTIRTATILLLLGASACSTTDVRSQPTIEPTAVEPIALRTVSDAPTAPPETIPPVVVPSAPTPTTPPEVAPPATNPRVTVPPVTVPPVTVPPVTVPPVTVPPVKVPKTPTPTTAPPVPVPPVKVSPLTVPPVPPVTIAPVIAVPLTPTCGVFGNIPGNAVGTESMSIDIDDDGQDDTVTTYFVALGDSAGWRLRTEIAGGPMDDIAIEGVGPGVARVLGGVQVDYTVVEPSTWARELLVQAGANASGVNLAVYGLDSDGCAFRFANEMGNDLVLPIHSSIGTMSGLRCDAIAGTQFLAQLSADHSQGSMYAAAQTFLVRQGNSLVPDVVQYSDIDADTQTDWLNQFGDLNCGSIEL